MKHKHADVMTIWLQDMSTKIQFRNKCFNEWEDCSKYGPEWENNTEYRIKPQPVEMWQFAYRISGASHIGTSDAHFANEDQLKEKYKLLAFEWIQKLDHTKIIREG